jgi:hypothetical protein
LEAKKSEIDLKMQAKDNTGSWLLKDLADDRKWKPRLFPIPGEVISAGSIACVIRRRKDILHTEQNENLF